MSFHPLTGSCCRQKHLCENRRHFRIRRPFLCLHMKTIFPQQNCICPIWQTKLPAFRKRNLQYRSQNCLNHRGVCNNHKIPATGIGTTLQSRNCTCLDLGKCFCTGRHQQRILPPCLIERRETQFDRFKIEPIPTAHILLNKIFF